MSEDWKPADATEAAIADEVRSICLGYPEVSEQVTWGSPNFRVRKKIFVMLFGDETGVAIVMKAPEGEQEVLLATGDPFFYPSYVGPKGWIGVRLSESTDWEEVAELVDDAYRTVAPKTLVAQLDGD